MMRFFRWLCVYRDIDLSEFLVRMKRLPKVTTLPPPSPKRTLRLSIRSGGVNVPLASAATYTARERRLTWEEQRSRVEEQP
jgi:hypothetical protein